MNLGKFGTIMLILLVFVMVVNAVAAEDNSVGTVDEKLMVENDSHAVLLDNSNNDGDKELSATNSQEILQSNEVGNYTYLKSLVDANPDGTIELDRDYAYSSSDAIKYVQIPHSITIDGKGHKISGESKTMAFFIPNDVSNVVLNNITFTNGNGNSILWIAGDHCLVDNCTFEENSASPYAPVRILGSDNVVSNSNFIDNKAYYGGAAYLGGNNNSIYNCNFENNNANYCYGGAVYMAGYNNSINSSTFKSNGKAYDGGAVSVDGHDNLIYNCTFENNKGAYYGSAVSVYGNDNTIDTCTFERNHVNYDGGAVYWQCTNGAIINSQFNWNSATGYGGAIYLAKPNGVIYKSNFTRNSAGRAGAVYISADNVNVSNSEFYYNHAGGDAGAIEINGRNNTINHSVFENNDAYNDAGAVSIAYNYRYAADKLNNTISGSTFNNNKAWAYGGAVRVASQGNAINDSEFYYNSAQIGGAVSFNSNYNTIDNSKFEHNDASNRGGAVNLNSDYAIVNNTNMSYNTAKDGGAIYLDFWAYYSVVNNSNFDHNDASHDGGVIYCYARDVTVDNSVFTNNRVNAAWQDQARGGAIYSIGNNILISNSKFIRNSAYNYGGYSDGGALNLEYHNAAVKNCEFEDNLADSSGGAIRWIGNNGTVYNSSFSGNNVSSEGGAIYYAGSDVLINASTFTNNNVFYYIGGALALDTNGTIDNSSFIENFAYKGGAIHWIDTGDCLINNSYFYKNRGVYAGGAIACDYFYSNADKSIQNTRFINNTCVNYGGAVAALQTGVDNCTFINNTADMGGAIHTYDSLIKDSRFTDNNAKYGNDIYHSGTFNLVNIDVPEENIVYVPSDLAEVIRYNIGNSTRLMNNSYIGMCFERHSFMPKYGAYDGTLFGLVNVLTGESIVEYLKLLVYESFNSMEDVYPHAGDNYKLYPEGWEGCPESEDYSNWVSISRTDYYSRVVHIFSDCDFRKSAHPVVKRILDLYDSGVRINQDHEKMVDGTLIRYHFSTLMSPASQSLFLFLIIPEPKLEKTYLNTTESVYVNDTVAFNITINNTGDKPLVNVSIDEIFDSTELEYIGHSDNKTWIKNGNRFTYYQDPDVGDIIVYNIYLDNTGNCNLEDIVISNIYDPTQLEFVKCGNADLIKNGETFLYKPEIKANEKVTLNVFFKMLNKDIDLTEIDPAIIGYELSQDNYQDNNNAIISIEREYSGRFSPINVGETATFTIWFKTLTNGTLKNIVSLNSIGLKEEIIASNETKVYLPNMTVEKIALNNVVYVGNQTAFTIVVTNTGDCDLGDVTVVEKSYEGLVFDSYVNGVGDWKRIGDTFILDGVLAKGASASFNVIFNTTVRGNFTNVVVANSNVTENKTANNNTTVVEPKLSVKKIALNNTVAVYVGDVIAFNIAVVNTGDCDLGDVTVNEVFDASELEYVGHSDDALWLKSGNVFSYQRVLGVGDESVFTVWFKTLTNGTLVNNVTAKSNVTDETPGNNTTVVYRPDMSVEKIALNNVVYVGNQTAFTIVVTNTGDCDLGDVTVVEKSYEGLVFDSYVNGVGDWMRIGDTFILDGVLAKGASASFNVIFNTTVRGNFTNVVVANSNVTENKTANNNTTVVEPKLSVKKIALNNTVAVYVGDVIAFNIAVVNTGDCDLGDVTVNEIFDASELEYVGHSDDALWLKSGNVFSYQCVLGVGDESVFTVWFKTLTNGTLVNNVTAKSNVTDETPGNNTTVVYRPDMSVEKIALNNTVAVYVGDVIAFNIAVVNTGDCDLGDVTVNEIFDASELEYVGHSDDALWLKSGNVFSYQCVLGVGDESVFTVWFKTLTNGTLVNNVTAKSNVTDETPGNNTTVVYRPDMSVEKIALNNVVYVGNQTAFTIVVTNTGDCDLGDVTVVEKSYEGLVFDSYVNGVGDWKRIGDTFILDGVLAKGASASFNVIFNTTVRGNFTNVVVANSNVTENKTANNNTTVVEPKLSVEKIALNNVVYVGNQTAFTIVVTNTGDCDLGDVTVVEKSYEGLVFDSYVNGVGDWMRIGDTFILDGVLAKGASASFNVIFNTTVRGNFTNVVVANSNVTENKTANNNTTVVEPKLSVKKIALNNTVAVYVGDVIAFNIAVVNTGDCDLGDVTVNEVFDASELEYVGHSDDALWLKSGNVFSYQCVLGVGDESVFTVWFKTLTNGTLVNNVTAKSNVTDETPGNNTTVVYRPDMSVEKIALNKVVYVGNQTSFTIVVTNAGDCDLGDVTVVEKPDVGLVFDSYVNGVGDWKRIGDTFILDGVLAKGASASFNVIFNTTVSGNFTNVVVVKSNVTENKTTNDTTEVLPICDVEIIKLVDAHMHYLSDDIAWTIVVKNNGPDDALNVYVSDILPNTLSFIGAYASKGDYAEGIWTVGTLKSGEIQNLTLMTKATKSNITIKNTAVVNTTTPETNTTNNVGENTTEIEPYVHLVIVKTVSNSTPIYGDVITWTITVINNGPDVAENVVITDEIPDDLVLVDSEISWAVGSIAAGESVSVTVKTLVNNTGSIVNVATVTTTSNNTGENKTNKTIDVPPVVIEIENENNTVPTYGEVDNSTDEPDDVISSSPEEPEIISVFEPTEPVNPVPFPGIDEEPVLEEPVEEPVVEIPIEEPVIEVPIEEPVLEEPVEEPVVEEPVEEPVEDSNSTIPDVDTTIDIPVNNTTPDINKTIVKAQKQAQQHTVDVNDKQTGNPIVMLLLALISVVALKNKRKHK